MTPGLGALNLTFRIGVDVKGSICASGSMSTSDYLQREGDEEQPQHRGGDVDAHIIDDRT
jgi:hypothetical protein